MHGPILIARALSEVRKYGPEKRRWQYNSRSDVHSSISCWAIMFDLLLNCPLLRDHVAQGKVGFGLNHEMRDFQSNKEKCLDLVICTPNAAVKPPRKRSKILGRSVETFQDVAADLELNLDPAETADLAKLPTLPIVAVGMVHVALEAKAAMTEFSKARPRLFSELDSSITVINGHAQHAIAAALVMVNVASEFLSTIRNRDDFDSPDLEITEHRKQPKPAQGVIKTVRQLKRRSDDRERGFDAVGILVVEMRNDGSPCRLVTVPPAPDASDTLHYDQMISRASAFYTQRFGSV